MYYKVQTVIGVMPLAVIMGSTICQTPKTRVEMPENVQFGRPSTPKTSSESVVDGRAGGE